MKFNPAESLGAMWDFLKLGNQKSNIPALKEYCYNLIKMMTQKTAGQRPDQKKDLSWEDLEMTINGIVIEALGLVLSGDLDKLEDLLKKEGKYEEE